MFASGAIFLFPDIRDLCILGVQGKLLVEGRMSTVRRSARGHGCTVCQQTGQARRLLSDPDAACQ
jgi:hypothetical protein